MRDNKNIVTMMNSQERNIASYLNVNGYDCTVKEQITFDNVIFPAPIKFCMLIEKFAI